MAALPALHERLRFDTAEGQVLDGTRRYLLLRADVLRGLFDELPPAARGEALRAFGRSVATRGFDSLRAYAAEPGVDDDPLQRVVEAAAASLGWGRWQLTREGASLALDVRNSPFAATAVPGSGPACHAIAGMLQGLAGIVLGGPASARETSCACATGDGRCRFSARIDSSSPAAVPVSAHPQETHHP
ncbi:MAG: 4-vinyl reductase [Pseudomonadota bacterium]|nr:4-vinyl reductase [Pseudomonadota bacterium]